MFQNINHTARRIVPQLFTVGGVAFATSILVLMGMQTALVGSPIPSWIAVHPAIWFARNAALLGAVSLGIAGMAVGDWAWRRRDAEAA